MFGKMEQDGLGKILQEWPRPLFGKMEQDDLVRYCKIDQDDLSSKIDQDGLSSKIKQDWPRWSIFQD